MMKAYQIKIYGTVQGIGFRPFISRTAARCNLKGNVSNTPGYVEIHVEGHPEDMEKFNAIFRSELPPPAQITEIIFDEVPFRGFEDFRIEKSRGGGNTYFSIPQDLATCELCTRELFDPEDRRHNYPFINCTACGPRFTIVSALPYDRENTSMKAFPLCEDCKMEYEDPGDRRFHAEPNACPDCGPRIRLIGGRGRSLSDVDPVKEAAHFLERGMIVAIKGLGGFHLAVDATSDEAVSRLRSRKGRDEKPFALMVPSIVEAEKIAIISDMDRNMLASKEAPIVIVEERVGSPISKKVAPGLKRTALFLPYTPLHKLILSEVNKPLVMTSGNVTDEPIASGNEEATERLKNIADLYLVHDREILQKSDDSVIVNFNDHPYPIRRARGYVPRPVILDRRYPTVAGLGGDLKNTFCIIKDRYGYPSQHLGDMAHLQSRELYTRTLGFFKDFLNTEVEAVCRDLHPSYFTSGSFEGFKGSIQFALQHHRAHVYSLMAESGFTGKGVGIAFDGTGYGDDGAIWGSEFFLIEGLELTRRASLGYFSLQGGDSTIMEPWKTALSLIAGTFGTTKGMEMGSAIFDDLDPYHIDTVLQGIDKEVNCIPSSSCGRLFDAVSAITGVCKRATYEGQAAMLLEGAARREVEEKAYSWGTFEDEGILRIDYRGIIGGVVSDIIDGIPAGQVSHRFHVTLAEILLEVGSRLSVEGGGKNILLSGGVFQNLLLTEMVVDRFSRIGYRVIVHRNVPTNDGGISLGQAYYAGNKIGG